MYFYNDNNGKMNGIELANRASSEHLVSRAHETGIEKMYTDEILISADAIVEALFFLFFSFYFEICWVCANKS